MNTDQERRCLEDLHDRLCRSLALCPAAPEITLALCPAAPEITLSLATSTDGVRGIVTKWRGEWSERVVETDWHVCLVDLTAELGAIVALIRSGMAKETKRQ